MSHLITIADAATLAGVSKQAVYVWLERRQLERVLTDDGYRIDREAFQAFLNLRRAAAQTHVRIETLLRWADGDAAAS